MATSSYNGTSTETDVHAQAAKSQANKAMDHLRSAGASLKDAAVSAKDDLSKQGSEQYATGKAKAREAQAYAESMVREKPIASIAGAFAIGYLLSKLL